VKKTPMKRGFAVYMLLWAILAAAATGSFVAQRSQKRLHETRLAALRERLSDAKEIYAELQKTIDYQNSTQYAEDYAHDELGWVYPDEIIIYNDDYDK
jgi:cell division protein FtsB